VDTLQASRLQNIIQKIYEITGAYPEISTFEDRESEVYVVMKIHIEEKGGVEG